MWTRAASAILALTVGCAHTVQVQVPPQPAVTLPTASVSVVALDRSCRVVANALVDELNALDGMAVRPGAPTRLDVSDCDHRIHPIIRRQEAHDHRGLVFVRRKVDVEGRAQALVTVHTNGQLDAQLLGGSRVESAGEWDAGVDVLSVRRATERAVLQDLARDLAEQVRPVPRLVERRLYGRPAAGSPEALYNRAVHAERAGDLHEALRLARAAAVARPSSRHLAYAEELHRRAVLTP